MNTAPNSNVFPSPFQTTIDLEAIGSTEKTDQERTLGPTPSSPSSVWSTSSRSSFNDAQTQSATDFSCTSDSDVASWDEKAHSGGERSKDVTLQFDPERSEMKAVFDRFDENNDGLICANDLARFVKRLGFSMSHDEAQSLVRSVDRNRDGKLDFKEFYSLYHSLGESLKEGFRQTMVKKELDRIHEEEEDTFLQAFRMYDTDGNGYISGRELQAILQAMGLLEGQGLRRCERVIQRVAANPQKGINLQEFKAMMSSKSEIPPKF